MHGFEAATFGDRFADVYDRFSALPDSLTDLQVETIAEYAGNGSVLEVGAGTGRIAIPLAKRGHPVTALEVSPKMADELRARVAAAGVQIDVRRADADEPLPGEYAVISCVFNTFTMLGDRAKQAAVVRNFAAALQPGGTVILETFMMREREVSPDADWQHIRITHMDAESLILAATIINRKTQTLETQEVLFVDGAVRLLPNQMVYLTLDQIDSVFADGGFDLVERWSDWRRTPYAGESRNAICIFRLRDKESAIVR